MCTKLEFNSRKEAKAFLKQKNIENRAMGRPLLKAVYDCNECHFWHTTSLRKRESRRLSWLQEKGVNVGQKKIVKGNL